MESNNNDARLPVLSHLLGLPKYVAGRGIAEVARMFNFKEDSVIKLGSNENPFGMSVNAEKAIQAHINNASRYPEDSATLLRQEIAAHHQVPSAWVTVGAGSSELINCVARAFLGVGRQAIISDEAFEGYKVAVNVSGGSAVIVPARSHGHDLELMAVSAKGGAFVVFITNPNNPTGTVLTLEAIHNFCSSMSKSTVIILDEAYVQFAENLEPNGSIELIRQFPNLLMLRTFSKAYGLAGMRVGYGIAQESLTSTLQLVRGTFNVGVLSQIAAIEALRDAQHLQKTIKNNSEMKAYSYARLREMDLTFIPSHGNFVMTKVGDGAAVSLKMLEKGVIIRPLSNYGLSEWVRISMGTSDQMKRLFDDLRDAQKETAVT